MGEIFKLFGSIGVDNKEAKKSLDEIESKGQGTSKRLAGFFTALPGKLGSAFSSIGKKIDLSGVHDTFNKMGGKINETLVQGVKTGAKAMAVAGTATFAAAGATLIKGMNLAGELEQNMGGSVTVFGKYATQMQQTGSAAFSQMGLSQSDFLASANKMGSLYQGAGFSIKDSMTMSSESMQRAADVASIMGLDIDAAMEAVNGMAKGNFTMMDNLGVAMNDTTIGTYALSKGIETSTAKMTTQEKVGLATQMFLEKTAQYAGNYAKENDTLAGSLQTAKGALSNFMAGASTIDEALAAGLNFAKVAGRTAVELAPKLFSGILQAVQTLIPQIPSMVSGLAKGMATVLGEVFGEDVKAKFESLVGIISNVLGGLKSAFDFVVKYKDVFTPIAAGIATVIGLLSAYNTITKAATAIQTAWGAVTKIGTAVQAAWSVITKTATAEQIALNAAMSINPIAIVITAIVALVAALVYFFTQTETGIAIWDSFTSFLVNAWNMVKETATEVWGAISDFLVNLWTMISELAITIWSGLVEGIIHRIQSLVDFLSNAWNIISTVAQTVWNVIYAVIGGIVTSFVALLQGVFTGFQLYLGLLWDGIMAVATAIWNVIGDSIMAVVNRLVSTATAVFEGFKNTLTTIFNVILDTLTTIWNAISTAVTTVITSLVSTVTTIFNTFKNTTMTIFNEIKTFLTTVWEAISKTINTIVTAVVSFVTDTFNRLKETLTTIFNAIKSFVSDVWNAIKNVITTVVTAAVTLAINAFNNLKNTASSIWNNIKSNITTIVNAVKNTVSSVWGSLKGIVSGIFNNVKSAIETPMNKAKNLVKSIVDAIKGFFKFSITWPKIPLPRFSINPSGWGVGDLLKGKIPTLGIDWFAKGGIMTEPTAFGLNGNRLMVGGEAGAEAIAPIDTLLDYVVQAVRIVMGENQSGDGDINVVQHITAPNPLTPREVARETKLGLQDLAVLRK